MREGLSGELVMYLSDCSLFLLMGSCSINGFTSFNDEITGKVKNTAEKTRRNIIMIYNSSRNIKRQVVEDDAKLVA